LTTPEDKERHSESKPSSGGLSFHEVICADTYNPQPKSSESKPAAQEKRKRRNWLRFQTLSQLLLGALTLGVLLYHGYILSRQQSVMQDSVTKQTEAIKQTDKSIRIAEDSMRYSQAAYLTVQSASLDERLRAGHPAKVTLTFVNAGNTPAYDGRASVKIGLANEEPIDLIPPLTHQEKTATSEFIAAPQIVFNHHAVNHSHILTADNLKQIQEQTLRVYVLGRMEFRDIFNRERWITFCFAQSPPPSLLLTACTHNNKAN
jgi:hypothetical protein